MVLSTGKFIIRLMLWSTTALVLLVCGLILRLSFAPLELDFVTDTLESEISARLPNWNVRFDNALIGWDYAKMRPWLTVTGLSAYSRKEGLRIGAPQIELGLARYSFSGYPGVSHLRFSDMSVSLNIAPSVAAQTDNVAARSAALDPFAGLVLHPLFPEEGGAPDPQFISPAVTFAFEAESKLRALSPGLSEIEFANLSVDVMRQDSTSLSGYFSNVRFALDDESVSLAVTASLELEQGPVWADVQLATNNKTKTVGVSARLNELSLARAARPLGLTRFVAGMNFPLSLAVQASLSEARGVDALSATLDLGSGDISIDDIFAETVPVKAGHLAVVYLPDDNRVQVRDLRLDVAPGIITAEAGFYWQEGINAPGFSAKGSLAHATMKDVLAYWPLSYETEEPNVGLEKGARFWLKRHVLEGEAEDIAFELASTPSGAGALEGDQLWKIDFSFKDLDTYAVQTMPPVYEAVGHAFISEERLTIDLAHAKMRDMMIGQSQIIIENLSQKGEQLGDFTINLNGRLTQVFDVLDRHPLKLVTKNNLPAARVRGRANILAHVRVPLDNEDTSSAVFEVKATVNEAEVHDILDGEGLRRGSLDVRLNNDRLQVNGVGYVNGVPLELSLTEDLKPVDGKPSSQLHAEGVASVDAWQALKLPKTKYLDGLVRVKADLTGDKLNFDTIDFEADLTAASLSVPELAWAQPAGTPVTARGRAVFTPNKNLVGPVHVEGGDIAADILLGWTENGEDLDVSVKADHIGENIFSANIKTVRENLYDITVDAKQLNLRPFIGTESGLEDPATVQQASAQPQATTSTEIDETTNFTLTGNVDKILLLNETDLRDADLAVQFSKGEPVKVAITASLLESEERVKLALGLTQVERLFPKADVSDRRKAGLPIEVPGSPRAMRLESANGGRLLRGLGYFAHFQGGELNVAGTVDGWGGAMDVIAEAKMRNAHLVPKSQLGLGVTVAVIDGVDDFIGAAGLPLNSMTFPFRYKDGLLDIDGMKANGGNLGITLEGEIEAKTGRVNINGVLIPAYGINSLLGKLPLVGGLFSGGSGKGLFGFAYRIKGAMAAPDISFNALSGLMPGFLRGIFEGRKGSVDSVDIPEEYQTPPAAEKEAAPPAQEPDSKFEPVPDAAVGAGVPLQPDAGNTTDKPASNNTQANSAEEEAEDDDAASEISAANPLPTQPAEPQTSQPVTKASEQVLMGEQQQPDGSVAVEEAQALGALSWVAESGKSAATSKGVGAYDVARSIKAAKAKTERLKAESKLCKIARRHRRQKRDLTSEDL